MKLKDKIKTCKWGLNNCIREMRLINSCLMSIVIYKVDNTEKVVFLPRVGILIISYIWCITFELLPNTTSMHTKISDNQYESKENRMHVSKQMFQWFFPIFFETIFISIMKIFPLSNMAAMSW